MERTPDVWGVDDNGDDVLLQHATYEERPLTEVVPEQRCEEQATGLTRGITEEDSGPGYMGSNWKITKDEYFCNRHQKPGEVRHLDGSVTNHPILSLPD